MTSLTLVLSFPLLVGHLLKYCDFSCCKTMELYCAYQKYDWGKRGDKSLVAILSASNRSEFVIDGVPYAELWMGVHPNGPSKVKQTTQLLLDYLKEHPEEVGEDILEDFGPTLPFLFKVLSVEKALSIQAHPSKQHAAELHQAFPDIYKDPNHKPELAIAVTEFEALCGFKPRREIEDAIKSTPELVQLLGKDKVNDFLTGKANIRACFETLMCTPPNLVQITIASILKRKELTNEILLLRKLHTQYPGDLGCLCVFWLNHIVLAAGEALFLAPNEPHAYISGSCVECMANSDNVVRAGLTPKFRDVATLCSMLTYKSYEPAEIKFEPIEEDGHTLLYKPPVKEFAVAKINVTENETYLLIPRKTASIVLCTSGKGTASSNRGEVDLKGGKVVFLKAGGQLTIEARSDMVLFQALYNA